MNNGHVIRGYLDRTADGTQLSALTDEELSAFAEALDAFYNAVCLIEPLRRAIMAQEAHPETV